MEAVESRTDVHLAIQRDVVVTLRGEAVDECWWSVLLFRKRDAVCLRPRRRLLRFLLHVCYTIWVWVVGVSIRRGDSKFIVPDFDLIRPQPDHQRRARRDTLRRLVVHALEERSSRGEASEVRHRRLQLRRGRVKDAAVHLICEEEKDVGSLRCCGEGTNDRADHSGGGY